MLLLVLIVNIMPTTWASSDLPVTIELSPTSSLSTFLSETIYTTEKQNNIECGSPENFLHGTFTLYDYSVVLGMLVISLGIGMLIFFILLFLEYV